MSTNDDLFYLRRRLRDAALTPFLWSGEDRNLSAFQSKDELVAWYGQPPGAEKQPYRDRGFYTRELAMLSRIVQPKIIVEFGTSIGIGTCLLYWLNPKAHLTTVDVATKTFLPGDVIVPMGYLARFQEIPCNYLTMLSWDYEVSGIELCFIDAEHTYDAVKLDSQRAWHNRGEQWAIAWHDYNDRHIGVVQAVAEFCDEVGMPLQFRPDSDTVWITNCEIP